MNNIPKYYTHEQFEEKVSQYRRERDQLTRDLEQARKRNEELVIGLNLVKQTLIRRGGFDGTVRELEVLSNNKP